MKTIATMLVSAFALLAAAAPGWASDEARFRSLVGQYLPKVENSYLTFAPKTLCICEPGVKNAVGVVAHRINGSGVLATCNVPTFLNGVFDGYLPSCSHFTVLAK